ncbi:hypothetical protein JTE90_006787 [Oedothorax gibbosus]|uniref:Protein kintoun n=1 Tax=Oedothorax gibbosus TaxID=931172 RepID=A0AAV6VM04_9ARAC|nr:hypothetical protein JTE90_006787 [Oedothorax gibbosus]
MAGETEREDLNLTADEATRLKNAFENKEFLKLFQEYVEDVNSEKSRKVFEEEIIVMEKERGFDVKFVHPDPVYVMKFVNDGGKIFINLCKNQYVGKPISEQKKGGSEWKIPTILTKPREDLDKRGTKCTVVDVMFHPKTIELARNNSRFRNMIEDTAVSMTRQQFSINLNLESAVRPKMKYKGKAPSVILRKNLKNGSTFEPIEDYYKKLINEKLLAEKEHSKIGKSEKVFDNSDSIEKPSKTCDSSEKETSKIHDFDEPEYSLKYRDILDLKDYSLMGYTDKVAPKQIIIAIKLPAVQRATEVELDVSSKSVKLRSCTGMPHSYILEINLCYNVDQNMCTAKFDSAKKVLEVNLPVLERSAPTCS